MPKLNTTGIKDLQEFYNTLKDFEDSFLLSNRDLFKSILHPALRRKESEKNEVFDGTVANYGLEKVKLVRNVLYGAEFNAEGDRVVTCQTGQLRGVIGPTTQIAVTHSYISGPEQVRITTLYSPIIKSQAEAVGTNRKWGLVMLQSQFWTIDKKTAQLYLDDAKKWSILGEKLVAWTFAEAARRIWNSNAYFIPNELGEATQIASEYKNATKKELSLAAETVRNQKTDWEFLDFTSIFQEKSLEFGIKYRMKQEESTNIFLEKCKKNSAAILKNLPGVTRKFKGVECLAYQPQEPLSESPAMGSNFSTWKDLGL